MKKAITSGYGTNHYTIVIKRADWSISFYDVETGRHYTRRVWYPVHGSDIYVQHRGGFYSIMSEFKGKYDPQAISRYETVSADELKSMTAEIIAHRAGKQYADDLTWEEATRVYAYAVICDNADTEATMTAIVNGILQNRDEQPEPAEDIAAEAMNETNEAMSEASEAERKTIEAAINYDPEAAAKYAKKAEEAAQRAEAAAKRAASMDPTTADVVYEEATWARAYADRATETAEQSAAEAAELKDTDAYAHSAKTYANSTAWTLDRMTKDHPETAAELAHFARVCADAAREAADNAVASYEYSRHTYYANYQTSAYDARALEIRAEQRDDAQQEAQRAEETAQKIEALAAIEDQRQRAYYAAEAIDHQWTAEETRANIDYYQCISAANAAARALLDAYADVTGEYPHEDDDETHAAYKVARDEVTGTSARATEYDRETVDVMVQAIAAKPEPDPAPLYQRAELDAYLGDYSDDYDVNAIEAEATEYDPKTGRRTWRPGVDLWEICERHEIAEYRPAIA